MLIKEIYHQKEIDLLGQSTKRTAVRAVIENRGKLLMILSPQEGDYKFPGGGVESGESRKEALVREVLEECGAVIKTIEKEIATIQEYRRDSFNPSSYFIMSSHYYSCSIEAGPFMEQRLDDYEKEYGFIPKWICPEEALELNRKILSNEVKPSPWVKREVEFLNYYTEKKISSI